ncbi:MAG: hypothetical protein ACUVXI_00610 [bacterium]
MNIEVIAQARGPLAQYFDYSKYPMLYLVGFIIIGAVIFIALLYFIALYVSQRLKMKQENDEIFSALSKTHNLTPREIRLVKGIAKAAGLKNPFALFASPHLFERYAYRADIRGYDRRDVEMLKRKLF